jgi:uncharacterized membrane protein
MDKLLTGNVIGLQDIQFFQRLSPEKHLTDALYALANNPEHPPLFYLMARFWMHLFSSPYSARVLAVLLGIIVLPFLYWLCLELFESRLLAWIALALFSISPYQILVSHAVRQYSLWTIITVISSIFLLKALQNSKKNNWIVYGISITLGLYSHLFFAVTCVSQGIYVFVREKLSINKNTLAYTITSFISIICFTPWVFVLFKYHQRFVEVTSWATDEKSNFKKIIIANINNFGKISFDFGDTKKIESYLSIIIFIIILYSIFLICRKTSFNIWLFILLLIFPSWLIQLLPDLIFQEGIRSLQLRYFVPSYLGIQICLAFLIAQGIESSKLLIRWATIFVFTCLIFLGLVSGNYLVASPDWDYLYLKGTVMSRNVTIAPIINQSSNPIIVTQVNHHLIFCLSYVVDGHVKFQLLEKDNVNQWENKLDITQLNQDFTDIFIYYPDKDFLEFVKGKWPNFKQEEIARRLVLLSEK